MKPMSGASPRIRVARLIEGEGLARRKAGLMECSEALLLFCLSEVHVLTRALPP